MLHRVRLRAKQSLEHLPRVTLPPRPTITIRIPLPRLPNSLPHLHLPKRPQAKTLLYLLLTSLILFLSWAAASEYHPVATLRYSSRATNGITRFETKEPSHSLSCVIDTSAFPSGGLATARDMKACVDAAYPAWSGGLVHPPPNTIYRYFQNVKVGLWKYPGLAARFAATKMVSYNFTYGNWHAGIGKWADRALLAAKEQQQHAGGVKVSMCTQEQIRYGGFLLSKTEKESCWDMCMQLCLAKAARAAAVAVECKSWGRGRGGLGKCWAGYSLEKRA